MGNEYFLKDKDHHHPKENMLLKDEKSSVVSISPSKEMMKIDLFDITLKDDNEQKF